MVEFCENEVDCRRVMSLRYFGETFDRNECNMTCDNCLNLSGAPTAFDFTELAISMLLLVKEAASDIGDVKPAYSILFFFNCLHI